MAPLAINRGPLPQRLSCFDALVPGHILLRKEVQKYFSKDFHAQKYFFWIFVKTEKGLEKIPACKRVLEKLNMQ
jgi:hypothetical protein